MEVVITQVLGIMECGIVKENVLPMNVTEEEGEV